MDVKPTPKRKLKVQPSTKERVEKNIDEENNKILDDPNKVKPYLGVAKKKNASKSQYYVNPEEMTERIKEYYETENDHCKNYERLGQIFILIAKKMATASCFARYSYKDEFIGEALIKMVKALRGKKYSFNYNSSPFSYFSQICYWAFNGVIRKEKKQVEITKKYRDTKYVEMFKDNENTKNVYIRPEADGEIFKDYEYYINNSDTNNISNDD